MTVTLTTFHGCETWSLTLRKEHRLSVFENRLLRKIQGLRGTTWQGSRENYIKRSFVICNFSPNVIRVMKSRRRWAGRVARMGAYRVLVGQLREKDHSETQVWMGRLGVGGGGLTLVNTVMNFRVPQNAGDFLTNWGPVSFSGRSSELVVRSYISAFKE